MTKPDQPLTIREHNVISSIRAHQAMYGMPPTLMELSKIFGTTTSSIRSWLSALRVKGFVRWEEGHARTIRVVKDP